jgi:hypothetical protein
MSDDDQVFDPFNVGELIERHNTYVKQREGLLARADKLEAKIEAIRAEMARRHG